ncbi:MAG: sugar phosphate isomerase/epimerase [Bacteroidetes bacterium]|nr:sugar phosphate isomerase/epimerase [Bacteroidota bacterium]
MNRKTFLQQTGTLAAAGILSPVLGRATGFISKTAGDIGLQLYTIGSLMDADPKGTLQKLAAIGYKNLESAGGSKGLYYGYKPAEFSSMVKNMGMNWRSAHVGGVPYTVSTLMKLATNAKDSAQIKKYIPYIEKMPKTANLQENAQQLADEAAEGGLEFLVCAAIPTKTIDDVKIAVDVFGKAGEACKKAGVQFAFHNHSFEFTTINGIVPYDYIMENTDKDLVKSEVDLGWATVAGQNPVDLFKKYHGRIPLWHVKDMDKTTKEPTEIGKGYVDFKPIFDARHISGMKYFFIEQDAVGAPTTMGDVTNDYNNLKRILA